MLYLYSADIKSSRIHRSEIRYRLASTSIIIQHALKFRVISRTERSAKAGRATGRHQASSITLCKGRNQRRGVGDVQRPTQNSNGQI